MLTPQCLFSTVVERVGSLHSDDTHTHQTHLRLDVFDWWRPLAVDEAIVPIDDFLRLPCFVEGRLHLDTDELTDCRDSLINVS